MFLPSSGVLGEVEFRKSALKDLYFLLQLLGVKVDLVSDALLLRIIWPKYIVDFFLYLIALDISFVSD